MIPDPDGSTARQQPDAAAPVAAPAAVGAGGETNRPAGEGLPSAERAGTGSDIQVDDPVVTPSVYGPRSSYDPTPAYLAERRRAHRTWWMCAAALVVAAIAIWWWTAGRVQAAPHVGTGSMEPAKAEVAAKAAAGPIARPAIIVEAKAEWAKDTRDAWHSTYERGRRDAAWQVYFKAPTVTVIEHTDGRVQLVRVEEEWHKPLPLREAEVDARAAFDGPADAEGLHAPGQRAAGAGKPKAMPTTPTTRRAVSR